MQTIYLDISNKGVVPTVYAKQGDVGRKFQVVLTDSGVPYIPANGSSFSVWYSGASGEGNYTDIGDKSAFSVNGNKVIVEMITQMLSNDGEGILSLVLNDIIGNQIGLWSIRYVCESVPGAESEGAKEYYTAFSESVKELSDTKTLLKKVGNPHNLLDNSDFRKPVNQRGFASGTFGTGEYTIDRWWLQYSTALHLESDCIGISSFWSLNQRVGCKLRSGKTYTFAVKARGETGTESLHIEFAFNNNEAADQRFYNIGTAWNVYFVRYTPSVDCAIGTINLGIGIDTGNDQTTKTLVEWAALYEGEYTAETLPEYQPKGYGAELAECMRYYQKGGYVVTSNAPNTPVIPGRSFPVVMRAIPTITIYGGEDYAAPGYVGAWGISEWKAAETIAPIKEGIRYITTEDATAETLHVAYAYTASADL